MNSTYIYILLLFACPLTVAGAANLPDPTRPPDYSAATLVMEPRNEQETHFNLTAVRIDKDSRSVILNGKLLREGEQTGSAKVLEIHPAHVVLEHDNQRLIVRLYSSLTKENSDDTANRMKITN